MKNFAIIGAAGYIAPRHMQAIKATNNNLVAALDRNDSVGIIDSYFPDADFFTEFERFDRHLDKLRRDNHDQKVDYISICSPNYLHDSHMRFALRSGADAICEKPLVINPWNLDQLAELEAESDGRVYTVLQLRLLPSLIALREKTLALKEPAEVVLSYMTRRGAWYGVSWKGDEAKSGGLPTNIGIHFFDLLQWLFGETVENEVHLAESDRWSGFLRLERANVRWLLSTRFEDLPEATREKGQAAFRSITMDGEEIEFSSGFTDLHTRVYEDVLAGGGFSIQDARPSIELAYRIRTTAPTEPGERAHPMLKERA